MSVINLLKTSSGMNIGNDTTLVIYPGGTAINTTVSGTGKIAVKALGNASSTTVNNGGEMCVSSVGNAKYTQIVTIQNPTPCEVLGC